MLKIKNTHNILYEKIREWTIYSMAEFRFMYQLDIARPSHQMGMIQLEIIIFRDATYLGMYKIKTEYRGKEYEYWTGKNNIEKLLSLNFKHKKEIIKTNLF